MSNIENIIREKRLPAVIPIDIGDFPTVSNEVELNLLGVEAPRVIDLAQISLDPEVNRRDIVELLVSMQPNPDQLNDCLLAYTGSLTTTVSNLGGTIYAGSSLLRDVSDIEPARYRTTSLSETLARNLLDITSQQVVIGIRNGNDPHFGMKIYNTLRRISPILLAMSASSPLMYSNDGLIDTGFESRRIAQYEQATKFLPQEIIRAPFLATLDDYYNHLRIISNEVNLRISQGKLDANYYELNKERSNGAYYPFSTLLPHQVYWMVRPRPDHGNSDSDYSLEVRVMDSPLRIRKMQAMNSFLIGICYDISKNGFDDINTILSPINFDVDEQSQLQALRLASKRGLDAAVGRRGQSIIEFVNPLANLAVRGLKHRGLSTENLETEISVIQNSGNDSPIVRGLNGPNNDSVDLERNLSRIFIDSLTQTK